MENETFNQEDEQLDSIREGAFTENIEQNSEVEKTEPKEFLEMNGGETEKTLSELASLMGELEAEPNLQNSAPVVAETILNEKEENQQEKDVNNGAENKTLLSNSSKIAQGEIPNSTSPNYLKEIGKDKRVKEGIEQRRNMKITAPVWTFCAYFFLIIFPALF
jgi:hypothetical protein